MIQEMNVLHINTRLHCGGAAIAAKRLHDGLKAAGHNTKFLVGHGPNGFPDLAHVPPDWRTRYLHRILPLTGLNYLEYLGSFKISETDYFQAADICNLHNLHRDYFSYLALPQLTQRKPAVWTLHDMWPFTGHCAYSFDCLKWKSGCGRCPYLKTYPAVKRDATRLEWRLKNRTYSRSNIAIVATSRWLHEIALKSMLATYFSIERIPHGICTATYQPIDRQACRAALDISRNKKVLMFAAVDTDDYRKGGDLLLAALKALPYSLKADITLLIMGDGDSFKREIKDVETIALGYVSSDTLKNICYNATDICLFPSRADIWSLVVQEAMACGTPSIAFDVGGVSDLIRHKITGLLVPVEQPQAMCEAIVELLEDQMLRQKLSNQCRHTAVNEYELKLQVSRYTKLYSSLLDKN